MANTAPPYEAHLVQDVLPDDGESVINPAGGSVGWDAFVAPNPANPPKIPVATVRAVSAYAAAFSALFLKTYGCKPKY